MFSKAAAVLRILGLVISARIATRRRRRSRAPAPTLAAGGDAGGPPGPTPRLR